MHLRRLLYGSSSLLLSCLVLCGLLLTGTPAALAQGGMAGTPTPAPTSIPPADSLNALLSVMESEVVSAAEAMPADKYDFAPPTSMGLYTGVRSFSAQVRHLTEANYAYFRSFGVPGAVDSKTIEALKTKDDIVRALKDSYAFAHAAIGTITPENAFLSVPGPPAWKLTHASVAAFVIAHSMDHYGQMVEYLRMNGIVPPASQPRSK